MLAEIRIIEKCDFLKTRSIIHSQIICSLLYDSMIERNGGDMHLILHVYVSSMFTNCLYIVIFTCNM